jgi:hypothetical protein
LNLSPHPSREGRGSLPGGWGWLRANGGGEGKGGGGRMSEGRAKLNHDGVDAIFKLRSPFKIPFNINAQ